MVTVNFSHLKDVIFIGVSIIILRRAALQLITHVLTLIIRLRKTMMRDEKRTLFILEHVNLRLSGVNIDEDFG